VPLYRFIASSGPVLGGTPKTDQILAYQCHHSGILNNYVYRSTHIILLLLVEVKFWEL